MNKFLVLILKTLNLSMLFHCSIDSNFDSIESDKINPETSVRFSIIYFPLGVLRLYILTINVHRKDGKPSSFDMRFKYNLQFNDIQIPPDPNELLKLTESYELKTLAKNSASSLSQQEEFLKIRISENQNSKANILNKSGYHTTIILAFAAVLVFSYTQFIEIKTPIYYSVAVCYLFTITFFEIVNLVLFLKKSVEVRGVHRSTFKDLRESEKYYALAKSLYFDWLSTSKDLTYNVGLARNTERSSLRIIALGLSILVLVVAAPQNTNKIIPYKDIPIYYSASQSTVKQGKL
jgi:hypothetical protein